MCGRSGGTYLSAGRTQAAAPASPISGPRRAPGSYRDIRQADVLRLRPLPGGLPLTLAVVKELSEAELDALIDEATVDCYNEDEELAGFAVMIEDNLAVPFETMVLGVAVTVEKINQLDPGSSRSASAGSTGRPSPSSTCRCQTRLRRAPNGSPPTATGWDRKRQA